MRSTLHQVPGHDEPPVRCSSQQELVRSCTRTKRIGIRLGLGGVDSLIPFCLNIRVLGYPNTQTVSFEISAIARLHASAAFAFCPPWPGRRPDDPGSDALRVRDPSSVTVRGSHRIHGRFLPDRMRIRRRRPRARIVGRPAHRTAPLCRTSMCYVITAIPGEVNQYLARLYKSSTRLGCPPRRTCALAAPR